MNVDRRSPLTNALLLYGLLAAPLAWSAQLVVGYGIGEAACSPAGRGLAVDSTAGEAALTAVAGVWALSGLVVSGLLGRADARGGDETGRIRFMAAGGVFVSTVFVALILLGGITALSIAHCHQS